MKVRVGQLALSSPVETAAFKAKYPRPALLFDKFLEQSGGDGRDTDTTSTSVAAVEAAAQQALADTIIVFLEKRAGTSGFNDVVTLGRATNQDISLPLSSVSKFHACFSPFAPGSPFWKITDMGTTNGTFVDGVKLARGGEARLENGKRVGFGTTSAVFVTPEGLHGLIADLKRAGSATRPR
jgi:pSer/pThr/pTyr-binding forkhead associated (FHA) protein